MNSEKVIFSFFIVLSLTLNFGFILGDMENPAHHPVYELFAVIVVNMIATILKFGDRTQMGAVLLSTSLVAVLQLIVAAVIWTVVVHGMNQPLSGGVMVSIVSLSAGAFLANIISVILLLTETVMLRR
jgi:hypothetical protein